MSREEIYEDALIDNVIQVSPAEIKNAQILSERTENGEVLLDVKFRISRKVIDDAAKKFRKNASGGNVRIKRRAHLERGSNAINAFFSELELL